MPKREQEMNGPQNRANTIDCSSHGSLRTSDTRPRVTRAKGRSIGLATTGSVRDYCLKTAHFAVTPG
jgi:hypothetical protein